MPMDPDAANASGTGRPILVGTTSVEKSELLAGQLEIARPPSEVGREKAFFSSTQVG